MKVLIIEDEATAYRNLERMLRQSTFSIEILDWLQSVEQAKVWLNEQPTPELIFLDVQLGDGLSFSIFENNQLDCPIIFTTAYDEYAFKAFELNSIDYLLKPFSQEKLNTALTKFQNRTTSNLVSRAQLKSMIQQMQVGLPTYKERFHVKKGKQLLIIKTEDIAWFFRDEYVFLMTHSGQKYIIDYSLDQIYELLDPNNFYRINRQFIAHVDAIARIETFFNHKLKITLKPMASIDVFVAKDRVRAFKDWLG